MSVNKVILVGHLGRDPEIRFLPSGQSVANFSIATSEKWTSNGQTQEHTEWHRIQAWGKLAEACGQYLKKGRQVYIEGKIRTREYDAKDGQKKKAFEIIAHLVQFLGGRDGGQGGSEFADDARELPGDPMGAAPPDGKDIPF